MSAYRYLIDAIPYKFGDSVSFTIPKIPSLRWVNFDVLWRIHIPQRPTLWKTNPEKILAKIYFNGKTIDDWKVFTKGFNKIECSVKWGTSSDVAFANPPDILPETRLLVFGNGDKLIKSKNININGKVVIYCECGRVHKKPQDKCECGKKLLEGITWKE